MKRIKSCSTLRLKAHQLLNEEEKEILKFAIRNYRKNQSIDTLCDILSKIITDSNRGCIVSIIADMLKEEQKSAFLHRCYSKLPGYYNISSQQNLPTSNSNSDFYRAPTIATSNLSLKAATFVSKYRNNHYARQNQPTDIASPSTPADENDIDSTLKSKSKLLPNGDDHPQNGGNKGGVSKMMSRSDSEELLKSIEKATTKSRPALANLKDKGFWYGSNPTNNNKNGNGSHSLAHSENVTDDDSSYQSSQETPNSLTFHTGPFSLQNASPTHHNYPHLSKHHNSQPYLNSISEQKYPPHKTAAQQHNKTSVGNGERYIKRAKPKLLNTSSHSSIRINETPRFYTKKNAYNESFNGAADLYNAGTIMETSSLPRPPKKSLLKNKESKYMICKLHFSSVEDLESIAESVGEIPPYLQYLPGVVIETDNQNESVVGMHDEHIPNFVCPNICIYNNGPNTNPSDLMHQAKVSIVEPIHSIRVVRSGQKDGTTSTSSGPKFYTDEGCQTSPTLTRDSTTQTFLC